jgi:antitoxin HicB
MLLNGVYSAAFRGLVPVGKMGIMRAKEKEQMKRAFTVSDGKLILKLNPAEEGGYIVTSPLDPELITEAENLEEAFEMARDALQALRQARAKLLRRLSVINSR